LAEQLTILIGEIEQKSQRSGDLQKDRKGRQHN